MASEAAAGIRNVVPFESFVDVELGPEHGHPGDPCLLMNQAMQAVHASIVGGLSIAVAFPRAKAGNGRTIGGTLRVVGSRTDVSSFLDVAVVRGLGMAGLLRHGGVGPIPPGVTDGVAYFRARPDKFLPSTWDRMDRRARMRRRSGKGLEEDDIQRRRAVLAERGADMESLPSFVLSSASTSLRYPIYVGARPLAPEGGCFTSFGLSDGKGAVPAF